MLVETVSGMVFSSSPQVWSTSFWRPPTGANQKKKHELFGIIFQASDDLGIVNSPKNEGLEAENATSLKRKVIYKCFLFGGFHVSFRECILNFQGVLGWLLGLLLCWLLHRRLSIGACLCLSFVIVGSSKVPTKNQAECYHA